MTDRLSSSWEAPGISAAVERLSLAAARPLNLATGKRHFVAGHSSLAISWIRRRSQKAFAEHKVWAVMHFAAASLVGESLADPHTSNNVQGTLSLLQAMRAAPEPSKNRWVEGAREAVRAVKEAG